MRVIKQWRSYLRHPERSEGSPEAGIVPTHRRSLAALGMTCRWEVVLGFAFFMLFANTASSQVTTIGGMAILITQSFGDIAKLITAGSYLAGIGFAMAAIMKFKQHKDNPTQIPIGGPIAMLFIASALLFFPSVLGIAGMSIFGTTQTAGAMGTAWGS